MTYVPSIGFTNAILTIEVGMTKQLKKKLAEQTKKWMQAQSALDNEKDLHRRTIGELGVEKDRALNLAVKLAEAIELAGEAIPYVPDYFREKYKLNERLAKLAPTD
jgi:hypothetical protein